MKKLILSILIAAGMAVTANAKTLVAYFSFPIDGGKEALDATSGASVTIKDGTHYGNAQFIAQTVAATIGADLFEIDTGSHYPRDYKKIFDVSHDEQHKNVKPKLLKKVGDMGAYDKVVICTPVWWYKMPLAVQSFLDEYDLSGKSRIATRYLPSFCFTKTRELQYASLPKANSLSSRKRAAGSRSAGIEREIAAAEPKATVSKNMLILSRNDVAKSEKQIADWARKL